MLLLASTETERAVRKVCVRVSAPFPDLEALRGVGKAPEYKLRSPGSSPFCHFPARWYGSCGRLEP